MFECIATLTAKWNDQELPPGVFAGFTSLVRELASVSNNNNGQGGPCHNPFSSETPYVGPNYTLTTDGSLLTLTSIVQLGTDWTPLASWLQEQGAVVNWSISELDGPCCDEEEEPNIFDFVPGEENKETYVDELNEL